MKNCSRMIDGEELRMMLKKRSVFEYKKKEKEKNRSGKGFWRFDSD